MAVVSGFRFVGVVCGGRRGESNVHLLNVVLERPNIYPLPHNRRRTVLSDVALVLESIWQVNSAEIGHV